MKDSLVHMVEGSERAHELDVLFLEDDSIDAAPSRISAMGPGLSDARNSSPDT
jgi:hypothetical protein